MLDAIERDVRDWLGPEKIRHMTANELEGFLAGATAVVIADRQCARVDRRPLPNTRDVLEALFGSRPGR